jgi:membrane-bound ClpP family serine protease
MGRIIAARSNLDFSSLGRKGLRFFPFVRKSYDSNVRTGSEQLIGERGTAKEWLRPVGYVQVHGQLWRAQAPENQPISPDSPVKVTGATGLTLFVTEDKR